MAADTPSLWPKACALVARRLGLHFPLDRVGELKRGLTDAAEELGLGSAEVCARNLVDGKLGASEMDVVASHLTIGETYFFRGDETFTALSRHVIPALVRARRGREQRLRIWSAGCCTGEEAYSLAILLRQLVPDIDDWHITILATDLNPKFLRRATEGVYGQWSFRGTPESFRERYFSTTPDGRFVLEPEIRRMVTFAPLNLAENVFPSLATGTNAMDLILCRNVLMYFTPEQARRVAHNLKTSLGRDGWLIVAPCEVSRSLFPSLEPVSLEGAILYRRNEASETVQPPLSLPAATDGASAEVSAAMPPRGSSRIRWRARSSRGTPSAAAPALAAMPLRAAVRAAGAGGTVDSATRAREAANQGRLTEALAWCDQWIVEDRLDAEAHYVRAMVLLERGDHDEARIALQKSAYLEPAAIMTSFALGNLERGLGRRNVALLHYRNTLKLLERTNSEAEIPCSEGISAPQLSALVRDLLATGAFE